ncbi:hypothetical protein GGI23_001599, partial [Coemansia sp. RSA 2559]
MTDDPPPAIPPDPAPSITDLPVPSIADLPAPSTANPPAPMWSTVAQHGMVLHQAQPRAPGPIKTNYPQSNRVSCYNILMGGDLNIEAQPAKIVPTLPGDKCLGYALPPNSTVAEFKKAAYELPTNSGAQYVVSPYRGIGILSLSDFEDLEIARKSTLMLKGIPVQVCHLIAYTPRLYRVTMRGLKISAASKDTIGMAVKKIDAAMMAFGIVQDISLEIDVNKGRYYISDSAELIILLNDEKNLPSIVTIDKATVTLTGKCVDAFCMYCKQPGHLLDKCPTRPGNKKHSHMAGEREVSKPTAPSAPPSKRNRRAKRQPHQA